MESMHSSWRSRDAALQALSNDAPGLVELLDELFQVLDTCAFALMDLRDPFGRCAALIVAKARNLGLACCGMAMDGLAQEAGALLRPLLEADELLTYLRLEPARVDEVLAGELPSAGVIAKRIEGDYQGLRDYLNAHASHLSVGPEAMGHYLASSSETSVALRIDQPFQMAVVVTNLRTMFSILSLVAIEAADCCFVGGSGRAGDVSNAVNELKSRGIRLFDSLSEAKA